MKRRPPEAIALRDAVMSDPLGEELEKMGKEVAELIERLEQEQTNLEQDQAEIALMTDIIEGKKGKLKEESDVVTELGNLVDEAKEAAVKITDRLRRWWRGEKPPAPTEPTPPKEGDQKEPEPDKAPSGNLDAKARLWEMKELIECDRSFQKALAEAGKLPLAEMVPAKIALMKRKLRKAGLLPEPPIVVDNTYAEAAARAEQSPIEIEDLATPQPRSSPFGSN